MRHRLGKGVVAGLVLAGAVLGLVASPASAGRADGDLKIAVGFVRMDGAQENPPADPDGSGHFAYVAFGDQLCYIITARNIDPPVAAHIHVGAAGVNGPIVVGLQLPDPIGADCITAEQDESLNSAMVLTQGELDAIIANEAGYYANVHTAPFPAGAIRGQLR
jgi:CHRD domain